MGLMVVSVGDDAVVGLPREGPAIVFFKGDFELDFLAIKLLRSDQAGPLLC